MPAATFANTFAPGTKFSATNPSSLATKYLVDVARPGASNDLGTGGMGFAAKTVSNFNRG
jgi:hypothetical protein